MDKDSLSQDEIDALLNSMKSGQTPPAQESSQANPLLSQEELDALLSAASLPQGTLVDDTTSALSSYSPGSARHKVANVERYDFTMPSRASRDHVRALRALHNSYARALGSSFSMSLRAIVEIDCMHIEQLTYGEYLASLLDPSCIGVFSMKSLKGRGVIQLSPPLIFPIIDKILGGPGTARLYNRNLTAIEETVITKVIEQALDVLKESWRRSVQLDIILERVENNPQFIQAAATADPVILILFDFRLDDIHSMMSLCFPFLTVQQALVSLRREEFPTIIDSETMESYREMVYEHIHDLDVVVSARYQSSQVTIGELLELQKGDIINLQDANKDEAQVFVSGQRKFYGRPGMVNGRRAVQVLDPVLEEENGRQSLTCIEDPS